jgi:PAS domain S-box-containing protein
MLQGRTLGIDCGTHSLIVLGHQVQRESSSSLSLDSQEAIALARLRFLYSGMPISLAISIVLAGITIMVLEGASAPLVSYGWFTAMVVLCSVRAAHYFSYQKANRRGSLDHERLRRRFLFGCTCAGLLWGAASALLFPQDIARQVFLAFVIAGISAGAITALSADRAAALGFVIPSVVPLACVLIYQGTSVAFSMGIMVTLYLVVIATATSRSHLQLVATETSRLEANAHRAALARSELERRVSDEKLHALFEFSPLGIALLNDSNQVLEANPALTRLLGWTREELLHRPFDLSPHEMTPSETATSDLTATGLFGPIEYDLTCRDGRTLPAAINGMRIKHPSGEVYRWAFIEDIRDRKAAETQLRALNDRLLLAAQAAQLGVWEYDLTEQRLFWDDLMHKIYAIEPAADSNLYDLWRQRLHPADLARVDAQLQAAMRGEGAFDGEFRIIWPSGEERIIAAAGLARQEGSRQTLRVTGINWDATDLKRVERMKSEFVSTVSHELRTPLTSIRGSLSLVANGAAGDLPVQVRQVLQIADRNAERLARLIDDLLDIEKIESGKLKLELTQQDLQPLIAQAIDANTAYANLRSVRLEMAPGDAAMHVRVDAHRLLQVMANLLSNAAKFSRRASVVSVRLGCNGAMARVEVHDQGPGIAPEFQQRLFTKFSQGDSSDTRALGGTGLGLAISKALVEQMGGTIGYESAPETGTTFYFELPLAVQEVRAA